MLEQDSKSPIASSRVYAENYAILHEVAERLRNGGPDDIDSLVADFRRAMQAYKICHGRLETIRHEIDAEVDRIKAAPEAPQPLPI
jgi:exonuclease VII small subunit